MNKLLDLELLYTFTVVADTESLKKTSEKIFKSHSAVSMQIKRLEALVGNKLIRRNGQKIEITEKGTKLLIYARKLLELNDLTLSIINDNDISGKVSLGIPTDYVKGFIEKVIPKLRAKLPNLKLKIICERSRTLRKMMDNGVVDIAIVAKENGIIDEEFLWNEKLLWVSSKGFEYNSSTELPVAIFDNNCIIHNITLNTLKNSKLAHEEIFSSSVLENIYEAVKGGIAVSLLPESLIKELDYKVLPKNLIHCQELLTINFIRNNSIDNKVFETLRDNIRDVFSTRFK